MAFEYDNIASNGQYEVPNWLKTHADIFLKSKPKIIDLACANGLIGKHLVSFGVKPSSLIGYDLSKEMINETLKNGLYTNAYVSNLALGLPEVPAHSANLVTAFGFFEFIDDLKVLIEDIVKTLNTGGELWCSFEANDGLSEVEMYEFNPPGMTIKKFKRSEKLVRRILEDARLTIIEIDKKLRIFLLQVK